MSEKLADIILDRTLRQFIDACQSTKWGGKVEEISDLKFRDSNGNVNCAIIVLSGDNIEKNLRKLKEDYPTCEMCKFFENEECVSNDFDKMFFCSKLYLYASKDFYCGNWGKKDEL